jgi:hypothetical protein
MHGALCLVVMLPAILAPAHGAEMGAHEGLPEPFSLRTPSVFGLRKPNPLVAAAGFEPATKGWYEKAGGGDQAASRETV